MRTWMIGLVMSVTMVGPASAQTATAPANPVMAQIFAEDQADRAAG